METSSIRIPNVNAPPHGETDHARSVAQKQAYSVHPIHPPKNTIAMLENTCRRCHKTTRREHQTGCTVCVAGEDMGTSTKSVTIPGIPVSPPLLLFSLGILLAIPAFKSSLEPFEPLFSSPSIPNLLPLGAPQDGDSHTTPVKLLS